MNVRAASRDLQTAGLSGEVVAWRGEQLLAAGFAPELAASLANDPRHDLHELIELVERGCSPDLAVRILAPLEDEHID